MQNNIPKDGLLHFIIDYIGEESPRHARKLEQRLGGLDEDFQTRAETFFTTYKNILKTDEKTLEYGIENYLRMVNDYVFEQVRFMQSGEYSCKSFEEAYKQVYSKPEVMEYYMSGLIMSQFLWKHHYDMFRFFMDNLLSQSGDVRRYLEVGGGHGIHLLEAMQLLGDTVHYDLIDISESSIQLAKKFLREQPVYYHLQDIYDYNVAEKYDFITMGEVLEHVEEPVRLLKRLHTMLHDSGRLFITVPGNAPAIDHIYLFHNQEHIIETAANAGFEVTKDLRLYSEEVSEEEAIEKKVPFLYGAFLRKSK